MMKIIIAEDSKNIPEGYRNITDEELIKDFLTMDMDKNYSISKNEWIINFVKIMAKDIESLEKDGPASILKRIQELSDEFDRYDLDGNNFLDFDEYKNLVANNIFISE